MSAVVNAIGVVGLVALLAALVVAGWLSWTAGRLDRMHLRVDGARAALDAALARRRAVAIELSGGGLADPASAVLLADAAMQPLDGDRELDRWQRESDLSAVLRAVAVGRGAASGPSDDAWAELALATERVTMARRIHNDLVGTTLALRGRRRVRWFRLAGHAPAVAMIAFDDEPPLT
ncbi:MAG: hypothetical protein WBV37_09605 [Nocardioidaceae bacterium]